MTAIHPEKFRNSNRCSPRRINFVTSRALSFNFIRFTISEVILKVVMREISHEGKKEKKEPRTTQKDALKRQWRGGLQDNEWLFF